MIRSDRIRKKQVEEDREQVESYCCYKLSFVSKTVENRQPGWVTVGLGLSQPKRETFWPSLISRPSLL